MKSTSVKSALFAALALVSLSCFIYVNTTSIDRALQAEAPAKPSLEAAEEASRKAQMPDLTLLKRAVSIIQNFFPAK